MQVLVVLLAIAVAIGRFFLATGIDTGDIYKDAAHLFVGGLAGAWLVSRSRFYWRLFWFLCIVELLAVAVSSAHAQILVPSEVEPYEPIRAGCDCIVPDGAKVVFLWRTDDTSQHEVVDSEKGKGTRLHIWAPPGQHWIEATVIVQQFEEITVLVPDPMDPKNPEKATLKTIQVAKQFSADQYSAKYTVKGAVPTPTPIPTPGPQPGPTPTPTPTPGPSPNPLGGFSGEVQAWIKAIPASSYSKTKMIMVADNYATIGSQGSDTGKQGTWNLAAFVQKTKELNYATLTTDEIAAWGETFFRPLATYQAKYVNDRKIKDTDRAAIAQLWSETAEAIRAAANSQ